MTPWQVDVYRIPMGGPGDLGGFERLVEAGVLNPSEIVAVLGKTEGNGGVNDFTREYASRSISQWLAAKTGWGRNELDAKVALIMSGGTEGVLSPHATVFTRRKAQAPGGGKRLAVGVAHTRDFLPEEIGRRAQMVETAKAVSEAMRDAGITAAEDVHFVQIKCPLLTAERVEAAKARGASTVTEESYASMAYSRGCSALGVALALKEISDGPDLEGAVLSDWSLYSGVASSSAGIELLGNAVVVIGNAAGASGDKVIGHSVMEDAADLAGVLRAFHSVGLSTGAVLDGTAQGRVVNVFAKAEPSPNGMLRGYRHTMLDDSDITPTRHARAAVGGLIAAVAGCGAIYVSGGAEHQGPAGGGPVAVIAKAV
jgi:cyanuric acid amidohydrolase